MRLFNMKRAEPEAAPATAYPGATCCMVTNETPGEEPDTTIYTFCGAPATRVRFAWEQNFDKAANEPGRTLLAEATAALPFCDAHYDAWQAARGSGARETFPEGTLTRWEREANEQAQSIVDTIMTAMAQDIRTRLQASEQDVTAIFDAIWRAVEAEQRRVFTPVSTPRGKPHKPVLLA